MDMIGRRIPFSSPDITDKEITAVVRVMRSGWLTMGVEVEKFEREFSDYVGQKYAVALNSCTAALHVALLAQGIGKGDEVLIPSCTFVSAANVVEWVGAKSVFVDVESESLNIGNF